MSNFIYYEKLEDYEEQVKKANLCDEKDKENKRLNNIINELENIIDIEMNKMGYAKYDSCLVLMKMKIKELKGSDENGK